MYEITPWPPGWPLYRQDGVNGFCDMLIGPCVCGATHTRGEFALTTDRPVPRLKRDGSVVTSVLPATLLKTGDRLIVRCLGRYTEPLKTYSAVVTKVGRTCLTCHVAELGNNVRVDRNTLAVDHTMRGVLECFLSREHLEYALRKGAAWRVIRELVHKDYLVHESLVGADVIAAAKLLAPDAAALASTACTLLLGGSNG